MSSEFEGKVSPETVLSDEEEESWDERFQSGGPTASQEAPKKDPRPKYNIISWLFFLWVEPLLWRGVRKGITQESLYTHPSEADSQKLLDKFNGYWQGELERKKRGKNPRLLLAMMRCILLPFLISGFFLLVEVSLQVSQSVMIGYFTENLVNDSPDSSRNTYLIAMGLLLAGIGVTFIHAHVFLLDFKLGMSVRVLMTGVIYQKVVSLSQVTIGKVSIGRIVNLASNDAQRFDLAFLFPHYMWIAPLHLAVVTNLVYNEVGYSAFLITGFVLVQVPLQILLAKVFAKFRFKSALVTDKRIRIMNEIITGIKVIKMYAWEYAFSAVVSKIRRKESSIILKGGLVRAFGLAFMIVSVTIMSFILFSVFTATGGELTPKRVFTVLSLLITLRLTSIHFLVQNVLALSEGFVAISRIGDLLSIEDPAPQDSSEREPEEEPSMSVKNLSASWADTPVLEDVSFEVTKANPLLAVVGSVGAGKSTLLQCLLGELQPTSGSVITTGRLSYTSQEPWLFSASLRDNVLFGSEYDPVRYNKVIEACALKKDIDQLVNGDLTLVGERGVTLSGGQKARVSLARAVYHQADIYILDDPLSAVDAAVAKHLFNKCIRKLLSGSIVILVTHQVQFALRSDQILGLKEGRVQVYGGISELLARNINLKQLLGLDEEKKENGTVSPPSTLVSALGTHKDQHTAPISPLAVCYKKTDSAPSSPNIVIDSSSVHNGSILTLAAPGTPLPHGRDPTKLMIDADYNIEPSIFSSPSLYSLHSEVSVRQDESKTVAPAIILLPPEEKGHGSIPVSSYFKYFVAGANILVLLFFLLFLILGEGSLVASDWWISDWSQCSVVNSSLPVEQNRSSCTLTTEERIGTFAGLLASTLILNLTKTMIFYSICINASRVLHNRMFKSILRTPMLFFDNNPIGRILNRFSKDVGFLDDLLPYIFCDFILLTSRILAVLITALVALPWLLIPFAFLLVLLLIIRWYYLVTSRDLKRLEGLARSPVYSHISTTLQGLPIVRSFGKTDVSLEQFHYYQNEHTKCYFLYLVLTRWLGIRMETLSNLLLALVAFIAVPLSRDFDPATIGLALTYIISLSGIFQYAVRSSADIENIMVSAERINEYSKLENEASLETVPVSNKPPKNWPTKGCLKVENVTFCYSPDLPLVLNDIDFETRAAEKIGVVGRTGAGKSSLLSVLFRLAEPCGLITLDGIDIQSIGLHDIRNKMSIIPQDPVLFSGTMRYNLDPFNQFSDSDLWNVLEQVQLKTAVEQLNGQLAGEVSEGGSNFSVGQKQLVCLARAMLRNNKILILDEATANVDVRTDEIIQQAIREKFVDCTVITIAHRLNTIMDSDRILVLSSGEVVEFDTPFNLLENPNSLLSEMVRKTGPEASIKLRQTARIAHIRKL